MLVRGKYGVYGLGKELSRIARKIPCHIQSGIVKEGLSVMDKISTGTVVFSHGYSVKSAQKFETIDIVSIVYSLEDDAWTIAYDWAINHTKKHELASRFARMKEAAVRGNK